MPRARKCKYCKTILTEQDDIAELPQHDKNGNLKFKKDGSPQVFVAHKKCHQQKQKEKEAWNRLYDYTLSHFFNLQVPPLLLGDYRKLRNFYCYEDMLGCLQECVGEIQSCKTNDTSHKCRLINYFLTQHLDDYLEKQGNLKAANPGALDFDFNDQYLEDEADQQYDLFLE